MCFCQQYDPCFYRCPGLLLLRKSSVPISDLDLDLKGKNGLLHSLTRFPERCGSAYVTLRALLCRPLPLLKAQRVSRCRLWFLTAQILFSFSYKNTQVAVTGLLKEWFLQKFKGDNEMLGKTILVSSSTVSLR